MDIRWRCVVARRAWSIQSTKKVGRRYRWGVNTSAVEEVFRRRGRRCRRRVDRHPGRRERSRRKWPRVASTGNTRHPGRWKKVLPLSAPLVQIDGWCMLFCAVGCEVGNRLHEMPGFKPNAAPVAVNRDAIPSRIEMELVDVVATVHAFTFRLAAGIAAHRIRKYPLGRHSGFSS